jgi:flagellar basal body-associated protein FliL
MKIKFPIFQILFLFLGVVLLGGGLFYFICGISSSKQVEKWRTFEPVRIEVDLSKPGTYTGNFHQTYQGSHNEILYIETPDLKVEAEDPNVMLCGLKGKISILDTAQKEVESLDLAKMEIVYLPTETESVAFGWEFWPFPVGEYTIDIHIEEGCSLFQGQKQFLVARYSFCGLEYSVVYISIIFGLILLLIGSLFIFFVLLFRRKKKRERIV